MSASEIDFEPADRFCIGDRLDGGFRDVGRNARILLAAAQAEHPDARHQHDARRNIEHPLGSADAGVVALEIGLVVFGEMRPPPWLTSRLEIRNLAVLRRRNEQRPVLGADRVIGRNDALLAVARQGQRRSRN